MIKLILIPHTLKKIAYTKILNTSLSINLNFSASALFYFDYNELVTFHFLLHLLNIVISLSACELKSV